MEKGKNPRPQNSRTTRALLPFPEPLEARRLLSVSTCGTAQPNLSLPQTAAPIAVSGYTPNQIRQIYGVDQVPANGQGQTIAIVDAYRDPNIQSDLKTFDAQFGLSDPPSFNVVNQTGGSVSKIATDGAWSMETALDVEWAHAIAPGANILLVEAKDSSLTNLLAGVQYARSVADVSVISMSWGGSEFSRETQYDSLFTTPAAHQGITFVAASGDRGAFFGVEWPASSPNVLAVGGTTMQPSGGADGASHTETPWVKSGSGKSAVEREPSYQRGVQDTGGRIIPDVALNADPTTGYAVYDSVANNGKTGWQMVGGTSAAAPQWGALIAVADQLRVQSNLGTLDGATQTLPTIYLTTADSRTYTANFNQISDAFYAEVGEGIPNEGSSTGLGTPKAEVLIETLVQITSGHGAPAFAFASGSHTLEIGTPSALPGNAPPVPGNGPPVVSTSTSTPSQVATPAALPSSSAASVPAQPIVFNDAPITHASAAFSVNGAGRIELSDSAASARNSALALAGAGGSAGELGVGLAAWLAGDSSGTAGDDLFTSVSHSSAARALAAALPIASPIASGALSPTDVVTSIGAPIVQHSANIFLRFANFDPIATFSDSLADFARESASVGPMEMQHSSHRAMIVTAMVIGFDALLAAHWYNERRKSRKQIPQRMNEEG